MTTYKKVHELRTWPEYFQAILDGEKTFEYRKNDRDFRAGDTLLLREWNPDKILYTGRQIKVLAGYVLPSGQMGVPDGYVIISLLWPGLKYVLRLKTFDEWKRENPDRLDVWLPCTDCRSSG